MNTDIFGNGREVNIDCKDSSDSKDFQIDAVKIDPCEIDIFTKSENCNSPSSATDFIDHKHVTDIHQEQNEEKLDAKNQNPEVDHSKFSYNFPTEYDPVQIKNDDDMDIFHEDIKSEIGDDFGFCHTCSQNFGKPTSYGLECSCQKKYEPLRDICHEDIPHDVKPPSLGFTTDSRLELSEVKNETITKREGAEEGDSSAIPQRLSMLPMEIDNEKKRIFSSKPLEPQSENHLDVSVKKHQCKTCSKSFSQKCHLTIHERVHTGEKPFHCKICSKSFNHMSNLRTHEKTHACGKQFHCNICSKYFVRKESLTIHGRSHTGEKLFHCEICPKSFSHKGSLTIHERTHTGEKPFHCKICSKAFVRKDSLTIHERSHTGEKLFHCNICLKYLSHKGTLAIHERSHTGEKPFRCNICPKAFTNSTGLRVHERIHTREKPKVPSSAIQEKNSFISAFESSW